jgi:hypothetical protein
MSIAERYSELELSCTKEASARLCPSVKTQLAEMDGNNLIEDIPELPVRRLAERLDLRDWYI